MQEKGAEHMAQKHPGQPVPTMEEMQKNLEAMVKEVPAQTQGAEHHQ